MPVLKIADFQRPTFPELPLAWALIFLSTTRVWALMEKVLTLLYNKLLSCLPKQQPFHKWPGHVSTCEQFTKILKKPSKTYLNCHCLWSAVRVKELLRPFICRRLVKHKIWSLWISAGNILVKYWFRGNFSLAAPVNYLAASSASYWNLVEGLL